MSKSEEFLKLFEKWKDNHEYNFYGDLRTMNHKTLEDVSDVIHDNYTEEWSDEVGLFIDKILTELKKLKP